MNSHGFDMQSMNVMKNKQSNRTKTVDTEKRSASDFSGINSGVRPSNKLSKAEKDKVVGLY